MFVVADKRVGRKRGRLSLVGEPGIIVKLLLIGLRKVVNSRWAEHSLVVSWRMSDLRRVGRVGRWWRWRTPWWGRRKVSRPGGRDGPRGGPGRRRYWRKRRTRRTSLHRRPGWRRRIGPPAKRFFRLVAAVVGGERRVTRAAAVPLVTAKGFLLVRPAWGSVRLESPLQFFFRRKPRPFLPGAVKFVIALPLTKWRLIVLWRQTHVNVEVFLRLFFPLWVRPGAD